LTGKSTPSPSSGDADDVGAGVAGVAAADVPGGACAGEGAGVGESGGAGNVAVLGAGAAGAGAGAVGSGDPAAVGMSIALMPMRSMTGGLRVAVFFGVSAVLPEVVVDVDEDMVLLELERFFDAMMMSP
jgi:hypothetical protein